MTSIHELQAQKEQLQQQLAAIEQHLATLQNQHRHAAITKVKELMAAHGLTMADLGGASAAHADKPAKASKAANPTGKVAAKLRDPASGSTWSGRGLKPRWLTAALADGKTIEEFAV